jgi:hypothetical protein
MVRDAYSIDDKIALRAAARRKRPLTHDDLQIRLVTDCRVRDVRRPRAAVWRWSADRHLTTEVHEPRAGAERSFDAIQRLALTKCSDVDRRVAPPRHGAAFPIQ